LIGRVAATNLAGDIEREEMAMTPCETRYAILVRLAWELRSQGIASYIMVPSERTPLVSILERFGHHNMVLVGQHGERWYVVWRGRELDAADLRAAARSIAMGAVA
jgi:hypothetical protein